MPKFSERSERILETCHPYLQVVLRKAIFITDFTVLSGARGEEEQNGLVAKGLSKTKWPDSKHNTVPSLAVDIAPFPIDWSFGPAFYYLAGVVISVGYSSNVSLRWGGDWDSDGDLQDQTFMDLGHFELVGV